MYLLHNRPQWSAEATQEIEKLLNKDMVVFEWGSGFSTAWFAKRVNQVITVDDDINWSKRAEKTCVAENVHNVDFSIYHADDYRYVESFWWFSELCTIDIVLIDGLHRTKCFEYASKYLKSGRLIILDDSERKEYHGSFNISGIDKIAEYGNQQLTAIFRKK